MMKDFDNALADLDKIIAMNPTDPDAYCGRAVIYFWNKGDREKALADLKKALELDPNHKNSLDTLKQIEEESKGK